MSLCVIKYIELILAIVCFHTWLEVILLVKADVVVLTSGVLVGYIIIIGGLIVAEIWNNPADLVMDIYWCTIGAVLFLYIGITQFNFWSDKQYPASERPRRLWKDHGLLSAASMMACAVLMAFDALTGLLLLENFGGGNI